MPESKDDPIAPFARAILELFREDLRSIRFPDLDHDSLAASAEELRAAQLEVECIEAALLSARELVREHAGLLNAQAARGLSYARVFAAGNLALSARLTQISLLAPESASTERAQAKKRGRPRRQSGGAPLFANEDASDGMVEARPWARERRNDEAAA